MKTDGYPLAIPETKIRAALAAAVQHCRDVPANRRRACATRTIRRTLCPCALTATCVVDALIQDFCDAIMHDERSGSRVEQTSCGCGGYARYGPTPSRVSKDSGQYVMADGSTQLWSPID